jgi:hypothetical protein
MNMLDHVVSCCNNGTKVQEIVQVRRGKVFGTLSFDKGGNKFGNKAYWQKLYGGSNRGALIGGLVGGICLICIIIGISFWYCRKAPESPDGQALPSETEVSGIKSEVN